MQNPLTAISFIIINAANNFLGIIRAKLIAVFYGVAEVGIFGQLLSLYNLSGTISNFGTKVALINLLNENDGDDRIGVIYSGISILTVINFVIFLVGAIFATELAELIFDSPAYRNLVTAMIMLVPLLAMKDFIETIFQADQRFKLLAAGRTVGVLVAICSIGPLVYFLGVFGVIYNFFIWFGSEIVFLLFRQPKIFPYSFAAVRYAKQFIIPVLRISTLNLVRYFAISGSILAVRIVVIKSLGLIEAGYFQAIWSLANYMNIIIAGFGFYLLPSINRHIGTENLKIEISSNFNLLFHLYLPVIFVIISVPSYLLTMFYTNEFMGVSRLLAWMALGKFFEIIYLFYIIVLEAHGLLKYYISLELLRAVLFITIPVILMSQFGLNGAAYGVVAVNVLALAVLSIIIFKREALHIAPSILKRLLISVLSILTVILIGNIYVTILIFGVTLVFVLDFNNYLRFATLVRQRLS